MNTNLPNKVADLLAPHSPEVRNLTLPARSFVFRPMPDIPDLVDAKARIIGEELHVEVPHWDCTIRQNF